MGRIIRPFDPESRKKFTREVEEIEGGEVVNKIIGLQMQSAGILCPEFFSVAGYATVFLFNNQNNIHEYAFGCSSQLRGIIETHADRAHKELKIHLMKAYGRDEPGQVT